MGKDAKIPSRAKIDAYPTIDKYGLVFAFLGDLPEAERPPIMEIPEWDAEGWRASLQRFDFDYNYERSLENAVDVAHNEFAHSFQLYIQDESFPIPDLALEETADGWETGLRVRMPGQATGIRKEAGKTKPGPTEVYTGFHGVSSFRTYIHPAPHIHIHQYVYETPIDEFKTRLFFYNLRNMVLTEDGDKLMSQQNATVAYEDAGILTKLRPVLTPPDNTKETFVPADGPVARYRERLADFESRGWRIDSDKVRETQARTAYAIPSPQRRTSKGWTIDSIPLVAARSARSAAAE
jgi:phenylpropionate dioxygenase-like ring-hydroxylating dioxygenase large terminal subunit